MYFGLKRPNKRSLGINSIILAAVLMNFMQSDQDAKCQKTDTIPNILQDTHNQLADKQNVAIARGILEGPCYKNY